MPFISLSLAMIIGVCLYAGMHFALRYAHSRQTQSPNRLYLLFGLMCLFIIGLVSSELAAYHTRNALDYVQVFKWRDLFAALFVVTWPWFVYRYTASGSLALVRGLSLYFVILELISIARPYGTLFDTLPELSPLTLPWGEQIIFPAHVQFNLYSGMAWAGVIALTGYTYYSSYVQYRRKQRRRALWLALAMTVFMVFLFENLLVRAGVLNFIFLAQYGFPALIVIMSMALYHEDRERVQRVQAVLDHVPAAVYMKDPQGRYLFVNHAYESAFGVTDSGMIGRTDYDVMDKAQADLFRANDTAVLASGKAAEFQETALHVDGLLHSYRSIKFPLYDTDAAPYAVCGISTDITGQLALQTQYRALFEHISDVILIADAKSGQILDINPAASTLYGYTRDEFRAMTLHDLSAPQAMNAVPTLMQRVRDEGSVVFERLHRAKDGRTIPVEVNSRLITLEGRPVFVSVFRDLTERNQTRERIAQSETKFRTLFETAGDAIFLMRGIHFIDCNPYTLKMFGCTREEIVGSTPVAFSPPTQYDRKASETAAWEKINAALAGEPQYFSWQHCKRDGTLFDAEVSLNRIDLDGHQPHLQAIVRDVTERRQTETALRRSQKMEAVGQLAGGVAHDFNNQLGVIIGYLDFLRQDVVGDDKPEQRIEWIDTGLKAAMRCSDLVRQLLIFSRRQARDATVTDLNQELAKMRKLIARSMTPAIEVQILPGEDLWPVAIDTGEFQDAILNLVINARDAMPQGGKLLIETRNIPVDAHDAELNPGLIPGDYVRVMVKDTGTGMDKATLERIFEPFFTTKPEGKGTGLGLAMVFGFTRRYNGEIKVLSELRTGTTFYLYLPRAMMPESTRMTLETAPVPLPCGSETILIVDDEAELLSLAKRSLNSLGYRVLEANSPTQALNLLAQHPEVNLLFSDVVMPGDMNGYALAEQALKHHPKLKVLLTSGFTAESAVTQAQKRFAVNLLHKPYRRDDLARRIRAVLDQEGES